VEEADQKVADEGNGGI